MKHRFECLIISLSSKIKQTRWNKTVFNYWHRRTRTLSQRLGGQNYLMTRFFNCIIIGPGILLLTVLNMNFT